MELQKLQKRESFASSAASSPPKLLVSDSAANDILERPAANCVVRACCVCYQQVRAGRASGETFEQTPLRVVPALASNYIFYGQKSSLAEPKFAKKIFTGRLANFFVKIRAEEIDSGCAALGGCDAEENVHRRKNRAASFHHVSRNFYFDGFAGVSADAALRERFACGRIHHRHAYWAAGN